MQTLRGEMQNIGRSLQAGTKGIMAIARDETRTTEHKMAAPRVGANELGGSATAVRPTIKKGEDTIIRETCWTRLATVEKVTVTEREKSNGVTETCTARHVETREIIKKTTEIKTPETREIGKIEERLHGTDGVKEDAHTHIELARDDEGELADRVGTRCGQLGSLPREQREALCPLEAGLDQVDSVVPREFEGKSAADGCTRSLGCIKAPGAIVEVRIPGVSVPGCVGTCGPGVCGVDVRVHERGEMRAAKHA